MPRVSSPFARFICLGLPLLLLSSPAGAATPPGTDHVTILYDAFGNRSGLTRDWGFAALVEYQHKRILFDTGNNAGTFAHNLRALGIDLRHLDFVVVSHRHGDHIAGLDYLLRINPHVRIYAPREAFGIFGSALPGSFYRRDSTLPDSLRYFDGEPPGELRFGTPWSRAAFIWVDTLTQVTPDIAIVSTVSTTPGTLELRELSLVIRTQEGLVLFVGCSHPGIQKILEATRPLGDHVHLIVGGMHLVNSADSTIARIAESLHDDWKVDEVAPGHCTGEPAFAELKRRYGARYIYAGLGTTLALP